LLFYWNFNILRYIANFSIDWMRVPGNY